MIYCLSDIHGCYEDYLKMLKLINLSDADTLYILGDVIDRGPDGIKILQDMMKRRNIVPILGNHEFMAVKVLPWLLGEITEESIDNFDEKKIRALINWQFDGGDATMAGFRRLNRDEQAEVMDYLMEFEVYEEVSAGGRNYVLVHAGLDNFEPQRELWDYELHELIFRRTDYTKVYFDDKFLVTGHTPTRNITGNGKDEIYEKNNHIAIDCGCVFGGKLAAICLDTLEKFYV